MMDISLINKAMSNVGSIETTVIIMTVLLYRKTINYWNNLYYLAFTNFIGTLFHELAHFCMALFLFKIPKSISVIPKKEGDYHNYGRVTINIDNLNIINKFPISIAPLFIFPLILFNNDFYKYYYTFFGDTIISNAVMIYIIIVLSTNAFPSITDIKMAIGPSMVLWILIIAVLYYQTYFDVIHTWYVIKHSFLEVMRLLFSFSK